MKRCSGEGRRRRAKRQPDHAAARYERRRRRRRAVDVPEGLNSPFGMALVGNDFYVANTDALRALSPIAEATRRSTPRHQGHRPAGRPDQPSLDQECHREPRRQRSCTSPSARTATSPKTASTRRRSARRSGKSTRKAAQHRVFASGLRNPNGMAWEPDSGALWTAVNERDEIGSDLVPDYMTSVRDGGFYGWPYSYYGPHVDDRVKPQRPDLVATGDRARLRARAAYRVAWPRVLAHGASLPPRCSKRHVRRPARFLEPQAAERLQGDLRAVRAMASRRARRSTY